MKMITLGATGITVPFSSFGALPIQRVDFETAKEILLAAYEGGMRFFDTARAYSDSEEKIGYAFEGMREKIYIATKTAAKTPEDFEKDLETSLKNLKTDYIDLYQLHLVPQCYRPGDGTGMYECLVKAKEEGKIRHFGVTAHNVMVAEECIESGLYETMQFPQSYLSSDREKNLVSMCAEKKMGYIAMKSLAGGLITNSRAAYAYMSGLDNVAAIWGIQKMSELHEWLELMQDEPELTEELEAFIAKEKSELAGNFCRGCGYCMPCPMGIQINQCARMSLMVRRAPSAAWLSEKWQENMKQIENCLHCGQCSAKCPYELDTPTLLEKNYEDYKNILAGRTKV